MTKLRVMIIVNPSSGCGKALDMLPEVERSMIKLGAEPDIRISENPQHATELAKTAVQCGFQRIAAMGGDGTVNMIAAGLMGSESVLGVIPAGTGNDFFRMLNIKDDLETICKTVLFNQPAIFDVGLFNSQPFFNMMGIGFDAQAAAVVKESPRNFGLGSYLLAVYKSLKKYDAYDLKLRIDNLEIDKEALLVAIGIGRSTGGGFRLTPQAVVNDGKFDVCIINHAKRMRVLSILPSVFKGQHVRQPEVTMYRCRQLEIFFDEPIPLHYEGETLTIQGGKISIRMSQDKLKVASGIK